jgi:hypothetical protein
MIEPHEDMFLKVLGGLKQSGALNELVLVGSWCLLLYREYFDKSPFIPAVRTTDMDLLVPRPRKENPKYDVNKMLQEMGFEVEYSNATGYSKYRYGQFSVEFLMPLRGKGDKQIERSKSFGVMVEGLRFLDFSPLELTTMTYGGYQIRLPKPETYTLYKLLIHERRENQDKANKDLVTAQQLGSFLLEKDAPRFEFINRFNAMQKNQQKSLMRITKEKLPELYRLLESQV